MRRFTIMFGIVLASAALACGSDDANLIGGGGQGGAAEGGSGGAAAHTMTVTEVTFDQAVQRPIESGDVPLVGGRDALVRVFYEGGTLGSQVETELSLDGEVVETVPGNVGEGSSQEDLASTFNVPLDGSALSPGEHGVVVRLLEDGAEVGRYPASGEASLTVDAAGIDLGLVFVPLSDGVNLATVDVALEQSWRDYVFARFPVSEVSTSVGAPLALDTTLGSSGAGWTEAMSALSGRRMADGANVNQFYVGLFESGTTVDDWCSGGCIFSLSTSNSEGYDPANHIIVAVSFPDIGAQHATWNLTLLHGVGTTGCSASGQDVAPDYPHAGGSIGGWGHDLVTGDLYGPTAVDVASQCGGDVWVSDYTFGKLFAYQQQIAAAL